MIKIITYILIALSLGCCTRNPLKIIPYNEINTTTVIVAEEMYFELFKACEQGSIDTFIQNTYLAPKTLNILKKNDICSVIEEYIGEITCIELIEAIHFKSVIRILRYQLSSTIFDEPIEFRIFLSTDNQLSEFNFYEWKDNYDYYTPAKEWLK